MGLLIWISKPNQNDSLISEVGVKKFFCGRIGKFSLNLQGVCDSRGRFLDASVGHPGSASDYLAFSTSSLNAKLERQDF